MSRLASPRTPSVPNSRGMDEPLSTCEATARRRARVPWRNGPRAAVLPGAVSRSALGVLGGLAGLLQPGLLALDGAGVTGEVTGALEGGPVGLGVDLVERASHTQAQRAGLAGDAKIGRASCREREWIWVAAG